MVPRQLALNPVQRVDLQEILSRTPNRRKIPVLCAFLDISVTALAKVAKLNRETVRCIQYPKSVNVPAYRTVACLARVTGLDEADIWEYEERE